MSILAQIGTKVGSEIRNLGIRMSSAENAIVNLGGQDPPPTGDLVISDVQWKNISEITGSPQYVADPENDGTNGGVGTASQMFPVKIIVLEAFALGDPSIVFPVGAILHGTGFGGANNTLQRMEDPNDPRNYPYRSDNQNTGNWTWGYISDRGTKWEYAKINTILPTGEAEVTGTNTLTKIGGVDGYNTGGSSTNFIGGESNGYFQFQLSGMMKIGVVYEDIDYNVSNPFSWKFLQTQYSHVLTSTSMPFTDGDWFRIRHYASENEIHFQRKQEVFGEDTDVVFIDGNANKGKFIFVSLVNFTSGKLYEITEVGVVGNGGIMVTDDIGGERWLWNDRADKPDFIRGVAWQFTKSIGQGYVTEFIHPTPTNGNDLFLDVSLREIGASVNDPKIAR